jgi:hypothetical protein
MSFVRRNWELFVFLVVGLLLFGSLAVVKAAPVSGYRYSLHFGQSWRRHRRGFRLRVGCPRGQFDRCVIAVRRRVGRALAPGRACFHRLCRSRQGASGPSAARLSS